MSGCESFEKYRLTWQELMATILVSLRTIWFMNLHTRHTVSSINLRLHGPNTTPSAKMRRSAPQARFFWKVVEDEKILARLSPKDQICYTHLATRLRGIFLLFVSS